MVVHQKRFFTECRPTFLVPGFKLRYFSYVHTFVGGLIYFPGWIYLFPWTIRTIYTFEDETRSFICHWKVDIFPVYMCICVYMISTQNTLLHKYIFGPRWGQQVGGSLGAARKWNRGEWTGVNGVARNTIFQLRQLYFQILIFRLQYNLI